MSDGTLELLKEWAGLAQDPSPDGLVFPSEKVVTPLSLDNLQFWSRPDGVSEWSTQLHFTPEDSVLVDRMLIFR